MYNFGTTLILAKKDLSKMNKQQIGIEGVATLNEWDKDEKDIATPLVIKMCEYLTPQPTIHEFDKDSVADQIIKVDIALEFPELRDKDDEGNEYISSPHKIVGFQIKSSEHNALRHMEKNQDGVFYEGTYYPCPGVFWCTEVNLSVLIEFANFTGGLINPEIEEAVLLMEKLRETAQKGLQGRWLDYKRVRKFLKSKQWEYLQELRVITLAGGRVIYPQLE